MCGMGVVCGMCDVLGVCVCMCAVLYVWYEEYGVCVV